MTSTPIDPPIFGKKPLTPDEIREVWRKIASGERKHGGFLTKFADAYMHADPENEWLLRPSALLLITKYGLAAYALYATEAETRKL